MPNHVRLILTPEDGEGLALALSRRRRLYAGFVNARARQTGHLFQGRFGSVALDEDHLMNAARYVALNPAPAGSRRGRRTGRIRACAPIRPMRDDGLVSVKPLKRPRAAFRRPHRGRARRGRLHPHQARAELIAARWAPRRSSRRSREVPARGNAAGNRATRARPAKILRERRAWRRNSIRCASAI